MRALAAGAAAACLLALSVACRPVPSEVSTGAPPPPPTRRNEVREVLHGVEIVDPYRWLEDDASPATRAWIDAQNVYTHGLLDERPGRDAIRERIAALMRYDVEGLPLVRGERTFVWRRRIEDELAILYVREGFDGAERALLDPHPLSPDHTTDVSLEDISPDGRLVVYGIRRGGEDETELRVRDVSNGGDLSDLLPRALYRGVSLLPDGRGFYYARQDRKIGLRIRYHEIGTPVDEDRPVFGEGHGPSAWIGARVSENGRHLLLTVQHGWARNEIFVQDLETGAAPQPLTAGLDAQFEADYAGDRLIVQTDLRAPTGRIVEIDPDDPAPQRWREIVAAGRDPIQGFVLAGGRLVVHSLSDVSSRLALYDLEGRMLGELELPGRGSVGSIDGGFERDELFFDFTSFTVPRSTFRADLASGEVEPWWRPEVPFDGSQYETKQVWITSKDGTEVPMFVVHRLGLPLDGDRPTLLYGYGGFDVSILPTFSALTAWWLEQGGVYAVPNLRGGGELGEEWHRAGMLENKQNVFDDFLAAAEWLVASRYTRAERLAIRGASNGGLLVGAALTQRPELFRAVLCEFPDLDMLGYYRFENNNPPALLEYGDASKPEHFSFLREYSPYQHVRGGTPYPAVLLTTGDADTRVPPLQARKMAARLQAATSSPYPVLLLYDTKAGHAGGRPVGKIVDDLSLELAFLAWQLGLEPH